MGLDILTEKGQQTLEQEHEAIAIWHQHYPALRFEETPKDKPVAYDGIVTKGGSPVGLVEVKCRMCTMDAFRSKFDSQWLVTFSKVLDCIVAANRIDVPFVGFLYLVPSKVLLFETIWRPGKSEILVPYRVEASETQATVNGGTANRVNAYLDMRKAKQLRG